MTVMTTSLTEAAYYSSKAPDRLFVDWYIQNDLFYICLADINCRILEETYDRFSEQQAQDYPFQEQSFTQTFHYFETMKELYMRKRGSSW